MKCAGVILCGGRSSRMGMPKASLPFGPESMLERTVRLLAEVVEPIVVVGSSEMQLPPIPPHVAFVFDQHRGRGPLEGLRSALVWLSGRVDAAYVTGCDAPLLKPAFIRRVIESLGTSDAAAPSVDGFDHPLAAVYHLRVLPVVEELLAAGNLSMQGLLASVTTRRIGREELLDVDPQLESLMNLNRPGEYLAALERCGYQPAPEIVAALRNGTQQ